MHALYYTGTVYLRLTILNTTVLSTSIASRACIDERDTRDEKEGKACMEHRRTNRFSHHGGMSQVRFSP